MKNSAMKKVQIFPLLVIMSASETRLIFHRGMRIISLILWCVHDCMKVVPLKGFADAAKSQESPPTQADVTEVPPTPSTQRPHVERSLNVSGAAAYGNPEASITSDILTSSVSIYLTSKYLISATTAIKYVHQLVCTENLSSPWNAEIQYWINLSWLSLVNVAWK